MLFTSPKDQEEAITGEEQKTALMPADSGESRQQELNHEPVLSKSQQKRGHPLTQQRLHIAFVSSAGVGSGETAGTT